MGQGITILIVDDDPDITEAMKVVLDNRGFKVEVSHNIVDGKAKASAIKPDLMILDVMMESNEDGFNLARDIKGDPELKATPILMVTGVKEQTGIDFKSEAGDKTWLPVDEFLDKPVKPDVLLQKVDALLHRK